MIKQNGKKQRNVSPKGKHQPNWLWGQQLVTDTLTAGRWRVYELFVTAEVFEQSTEFLQTKQKEGIELEVVPVTRLEQLARTAEHKGIVARVSKYPYAAMESLEKELGIATEQAETPSFPGLVVILDRVQDANEFGAILRCCRESQVRAVIVGEHCQAQVTTQVARSSLGAVNHFPIVKTSDLAIAARSVQSLGFQLVANDPHSKQAVYDTPLNAPTALIIGNDMQTMDPILSGLCDHRVSIPMTGTQCSLNCSLNTDLSAGILLYEIRRQQRFR